MLISATRLHIRSLPALVPFVLENERVVQQTLRAPGFLKGKLLVDRWATFWTITLWESEAAMKAYRGSGPHAAAMPKLAGWCDEASVAHWETSDTELPDWGFIHERMTTIGRKSRVNRPSKNHEAGRIPAPRKLTERPLTPKRA